MTIHCLYLLLLLLLHHNPSSPFEQATMVFAPPKTRFVIAPFHTSQDLRFLQITFMHPSSVNHTKRDPNEKQVAFGEKQLYSFTEKRQNLSASAPGASASTLLVTTTRLDPMTYVLFGAYEIAVTERGLDCDGWLPIVGNIDGLDDIQRLKTLMEACMLRVFEGIVMGRR